ncbi:CHAT domain-containing protein [Steroidobacter sp.]|uniref:CHAT domain-containing protein n=1 Tax=Steroidobacter sp. TaxID=1978227 RepID=UPI001A3EBDC0|nr:CHAT domain-containing protein [Steroidobacter sp.]MBL8268959.1 CHAT domain-containing protein [Steroidobacter sp.]
MAEGLYCISIACLHPAWRRLLRAVFAAALMTTLPVAQAADECRSELLSGLLDAALLSCQQEYSLAPTDTDANVNLGHLWLLRGEHDKARPYYQYALQNIGSDDARVALVVDDWNGFIEQRWRKDDSTRTRDWFVQSSRRMRQADALLLEADGLEQAQQPKQAEQLYRRALAIDDATLGPMSRRSGIAVIKLARLLTLQQRRAEALPLMQRLLAITEALRGPDHSDVANVLDGLGHLLQDLERPAEGAAHLQRALAIVRKNDSDNSGLINRSVGALVSMLQSMGRDAEVEQVYRDQLALEEARFGADRPATVQDMYRLAGALVRTGKVAEAESLYRRTLKMHETRSAFWEPIVAADDLHALGALLSLTGRYAEAEELLNRALALRVAAGEPFRFAAAATQKDIGVLLSVTGRYTQAEVALREALRILDEMVAKDPRLPLDPAAMTATLDALAALLTMTGREDQAKPFMARSIQIRLQGFAGTDPEMEPRVNDLSRLYTDGVFDASVERSYRFVLDFVARRMGTDNKRLASLLEHFGEQLRLAGRPAEALPYLERALQLGAATENQRLPTIRVSQQLGRTHLDLGQYTKAEQWLLQAYRGADSSGAQGMLWSIQRDLQLVYVQQRQHALAAFYGKQAVNTLQALRSDLSADASVQKSYARKVASVYQELASLLIDQGRFAEAEQVLAMIKEEEYFDFIRRDAQSDPRTTLSSYDGVEREWLQRYAQISERLVMLGKEHAALERIAANLRTPEQSARWQVLTADLEVARQAFDEYIANLRAAFTAATEARRTALAKQDLDELLGVQGALAEVQQHSGKSVALVHYLVMPDRLRMLITTPEVQVARDRVIAEPELNRLVFAFRSALQSRAVDPRPAAQALYRQLIAPLESDLTQIQPDVLMVSLDGVLRYVPIAALHDGKGWLTERFALATYNPAARASFVQGNRERWQIAALGMSQAVEDFPELPNVPFELDDIVQDAANPTDLRGTLPGVVYLDDAFVPDALIDVLRDKDRYPVVHVASHFRFVPGNEADSFLLAGSGQRVSLDEIRKGRFRLYGLDLLTLSACETAMGGGEANGREVESLGVTAQKLGAKSVIATLWSVADASTGLFMSRLYRVRQADQVSKADALRLAQLAMIRGEIGDRNLPEALRGVPHPETAPSADRKRAPAFSFDPDKPYSHPYFWAPFILMGNWL